MIIDILLVYRRNYYPGGGDQLAITAKHAYRDARGRLVTPSHTRELRCPYPSSITDGLNDGIAVLYRLLESRKHPFEVPETGDPVEAPWQYA